MGCGCRKNNAWTVTINGQPTDRAFPTRASAQIYATKVGGEVVRR